ncbi:MAG: hypothetical protein ACWA5W_09800, partial [Phycisphaerales bacterium]
EKGDFHSVSLDQAADRLKSIAKDDISVANRTFEPIRKRRNRVIHFHAADLPDQPSSPRKESLQRHGDLFKNAPDDVVEVVREQCVAWFELHCLLTKRWHRYFGNYRRKIEWLDRRMRELMPYLQARFER